MASEWDIYWPIRFPFIFALVPRYWIKSASNVKGIIRKQSDSIAIGAFATKERKHGLRIADILHLGYHMSLVCVGLPDVLVM